ncbi:tyrosine-type recombinase/integrase [Rhodopirellula bahusiensis]|uniref:tyrosine-type recombinase/integrase n=2 Tax=Rhodopirellula bahusiensis TaxID=2014065 RepID=UPI003263C806
MPKLSKSLPKYRKHKASGQAVVTIAGRDHYLGPHGTAASKREYDRRIAEYLATGRRGVIEDETQIRVIEVLAAYWKFAKGYYVKNGKPTSEVDALRLVIGDCKKLYADLPAESFGPLALKAVRQRWIDRGQSRPTVNKNMRRLTRIFRWAVAEEMVPGSVIHSLTAVPGLKRGRCDLPEPKPIDPVNLHTVEVTLRFLPPVTADMVRFQLLTGARPGEVCRMRPADIDRGGEVWEYVDSDHKTVHHGRKRTVFIGPDAQAILRPYLLREPSAVCFSMREANQQRRNARHDKRTTPLSCGNRPGKRSNADRAPGRKRRRSKEQFDAGSYRAAIHHACDAAFDAGAPLGRMEGESDRARKKRLTSKQLDELDTWQRSNRWNPNQLRHTRGTEIRKRFGLEAAQVILGHAAADVTQIYAERDREKAIEVARQVG